MPIYQIKGIYLTFLFTAIILCCMAQHPSNFSAEILLGPSIPTGSFADKDYSAVTNSSGLAKTGFSIYANFKDQFSKHFGIILSVEGSFNKQDPATISSYLNEGANSSIDTKIQTYSWQIVKILTGLYYTAHFNNPKLSYNLSFMGGVCKTSVPKYYWAVYTQSGSLYNERQQDAVSLPWSFGYLFGASLRYDLKKSTYLLLSTDYFNAASQLSTSNLKYEFGSINIMVGAGLSF
jgi:hypothetical protein